MQFQQACAQYAYAKKSAHGLWICVSHVVDSEAMHMLR